MPVFAFDDLTPRDEIAWAQTMTAYLPYMTESQLRQLFDELGYPVPDDETPEKPQAQQVSADMATNMATQKGVPKPVLRKSRQAREEFAEEIRRLRDELARALF
jgi:hypothetical protein